MQNPPKVKNLAPGSLPSGSGIRSNDRINRNEISAVPLNPDHALGSKIRYSNLPIYDNTKDNTQNSSYGYQN